MSYCSCHIVHHVILFMSYCSCHIVHHVILFIMSYCSCHIVHHVILWYINNFTNRWLPYAKCFTACMHWWHHTWYCLPIMMSHIRDMWQLWVQLLHGLVQHCCGVQGLFECSQSGRVQWIFGALHCEYANYNTKQVGMQQYFRQSHHATGSLWIKDLDTVTGIVTMNSKD